jgi:hypothetical protein
MAREACRLDRPGRTEESNGQRGLAFGALRSGLDGRCPEAFRIRGVVEHCLQPGSQRGLDPEVRLALRLLLPTGQAELDGRPEHAGPECVTGGGALPLQRLHHPCRLGVTVFAE